MSNSFMPRQKYQQNKFQDNTWALSNRNYTSQSQKVPSFQQYPSTMSVDQQSFGQTMHGK